MRLLLVGLIGLGVVFMAIALGCSADPVVEAPTEAEDQQRAEPNGNAASLGQWEDIQALERELTEVLGFSWEIASIQTTDGVMKIQAGNRQIPKAMYVAALTSICHTIDKKGGAPAIKEIQLVNSFGKQGFVYERPSKCGELLNVPVSDLELSVALDTHTF